MNRPPVIEYRAKGGEVVLRHVASYNLPPDILPKLFREYGPLLIVLVR